MRLKSVYIDHNKNLKQFTLPFDGDSFVDVFVGRCFSQKGAPIPLFSKKPGTSCMMRTCFYSLLRIQLWFHQTNSHQRIGGISPNPNLSPDCLGESPEIKEQDPLAA